MAEEAPPRAWARVAEIEACCAALVARLDAIQPLLADLDRRLADIATTVAELASGRPTKGK